MIPLLAVALNGFTLVQSTPRADYYALRPGLRVDVKSCERFLDDTERKLGVRLPHFEYYRVDTPADVFLNSADHHYAGGIANQQPLYAVAIEPCSRHELAHLLVYQLGRATPVFEEGAASLLADDYDFVERWNAEHEARSRDVTYAQINGSFVTYSGSTAQLHTYYVVSMAFCRHLIGKDGLQRFMSFLHKGPAVRVSVATDETAAAFREVYGTGPDEAFDRWLHKRQDPSRK